MSKLKNNFRINYPITVGELFYLNENMAEMEALEMYYYTGNTLGSTPISSFSDMGQGDGVFSASLYYKDKLLGIGGIDDGIVWFLPTNHIYEIPTTYLRYMKKLLKFYLKKYRTLYNFVWEKNTVAIKWLKWLGADIHYNRPIMYHKGQKFYPFYFHYYKE